jgi:hypothetical protein
MFEDLTQFQRIVVSGPHRSGTTICGEMIAADTGYKALREEAFGWSDENHFAQCLLRTNVVLQAPFMAHRLHLLHETVDPQTVCVVMMMRAIGDIAQSQGRMIADDGTATGRGIARYRARALHTGSPSPAVIYLNWQQQKLSIAHFREQQYEDLRGHPLWLDPGDRLGFSHRQTS